MTNLDGAAAIVTGASSGIGEATAIALARAGAAVTLAARRENRLRDLRGRIEAAGGRALAVECDVTERDAVRRLVERAEEAFGPVRILINNAGVMPLAPLAKTRFDDWDLMIDVNVRGALNVLGAVLPGLIERNDGHVVNVSSVAGRRVFPNGAVYCGTKHALNAISEGLRMELSMADPPVDGVRVTVVEPGVVKTELQDSIADEETRRSMKEYVATMKAPLESEDIADAIMFALTAPRHVDVNEILIRPAEQVR